MQENKGELRTKASGGPASLLSPFDPFHTSPSPPPVRAPLAHVGQAFLPSIELLDFPGYMTPSCRPHADRAD